LPVSQKAVVEKRRRGDPVDAEVGGDRDVGRARLQSRRRSGDEVGRAGARRWRLLPLPTGQPHSALIAKETAAFVGYSGKLDRAQSLAVIDAAPSAA
jgi:hypothetical protein